MLYQLKALEFEVRDLCMSKDSSETEFLFRDQIALLTKNMCTGR